MPYKPEFFEWIRRQLIVVEDWPYSGMDFTGDADLPHPVGEDWDEALGKTHFFILMSIMIFLIIYVLMLILVFADVGPERLAGMSPIARGIPHDFDVAPHGEGSEHEEIVYNVEGLTSKIPNYTRFDDVPHAYQRHTTWVSNRVHRLLRRFVRAVTCYHEHHAD